MKIAVACSGGSFRGIFIHGVLEAFNRAGFRPDAFAAASSSAVLAAHAAVGKLDALESVQYWKLRVKGVQVKNFDMSQCIKIGNEMSLPQITKDIFDPANSRLLIGASVVTTHEGRELTQGSGASKLGRQLMVAASKKDRSWADQNLKPVLFDSYNIAPALPLTPSNMFDVFYATTRMLNGWKDPAWVDGLACIDAAYTCHCPAVQAAELGYDLVIAVSTEPGPIFEDIFGVKEIPGQIGRTRVIGIQPDMSPGTLGVDFLTADEEGIDRVFQHGIDKGLAFIRSLEKTEDRVLAQAACA